MIMIINNNHTFLHCCKTIMNNVWVVLSSRLAPALPEQFLFHFKRDPMLLASQAYPEVTTPLHRTAFECEERQLHFFQCHHTGVCEQMHSFKASLGHSMQQQKLLSSPPFGALKADFPSGLLLGRSVFFTDTSMLNTHLWASRPTLETAPSCNRTTFFNSMSESRKVYIY